MVKHVVMVKLKEFDSKEEKQEKAKKFKKMLEDLVDKITELKAMEVGLNFNPNPVAYDVVLISEFETIEGLENYRKHPEHVIVLDFLKEIMNNTVVVDYEI